MGEDIGGPIQRLCVCGHAMDDHINGWSVCTHHKGLEWCPCSRFADVPPARKPNEFPVVAFSEKRRRAFFDEYRDR